MGKEIFLGNESAVLENDWKFSLSKKDSVLTPGHMTSCNVKKMPASARSLGFKII